MPLPALLAVYCLAIMGASLLGGWVPLRVRLTHNRLQIANSLIGGFMLGVALLHLLPHALLHAAPGPVTLWMTAGVLTMFILERIFHYHQHDIPSHPGADCDEDDPGHSHDHHHDCDHTHEDPAAPHYDGKTPKLSWGGAAIGLILHSVIAGIGLGAAMKSESGPEFDAVLPGLAILIVIVLHKPFDSMTLLALVVKGGHSHRRAHLINALFALAVPSGAALFIFGIASGAVEHSAVVSYAMGFAAGVFLCIALSDLLPELHFHRHDAGKLTVCLAIGLALAWTINFFEMKNHNREPQVDNGYPTLKKGDRYDRSLTRFPDTNGWHLHDHDKDGVVDH
ncbi:MAG: ZIP family metal transporter [Planctomycetota bacterium]